MSKFKISRRQAIAGAASAAASALAAPAVAIIPRRMGGGISSPPIFLRGRIIGRPIREAVLPTTATHFVGGRVTGYTTFKLEQNDVLAEFLRTSNAGPCQMRCVVYSVPGDSVLWVQALSIVDAEDEPLPNRDATLEQEPLTSQEEQALSAFMVMLLTAWMDNPDSLTSLRINEASVSAFDGMDASPGYQSKTVATPVTSIEDPQTGLVEGASLIELVDESQDSNPCVIAIGKAVLFFIVQLIFGVLSPPMRQEVAAQAGRLWTSPIGPALRQLLDVFTKRGLKGNARGDLLKGALVNLLAVGAGELATSLIAVLKKTAWYRFAPAVAKALGLVAAAASLVVSLYTLATTMKEIADNC